MKNCLVKLSVGDAVAQELRYHGGCLTPFYNRERSTLKKKQTDDEDSPVTDIKLSHSGTSDTYS